MKIPHLCKVSEKAVSDENVAYVYRPWARQWRIRFMERGILVQVNDQYNTAKYAIDGILTYYCPWCGTRMPGSLYAHFVDLVEGDKDDFRREEFHEDYLPAEFLDDTWWRDRSIPDDYSDFPRVGKPTYRNDEMMEWGYTESPPGFLRPLARSPHLCHLMQSSLEHEGDMIAYLPQTREYGVRILDLDEPVDYQPIRIMPFHYCPWCGDKLPSSLREEWETRLKAEGLEADDPCIPTNLPEHWGTDQWWRAEGL